MERVHLINGSTGTDMWVTADKVEEYLAAGHKLAAAPVEKPAEEKPKTAKKKTAKKG